MRIFGDTFRRHLLNQVGADGSTGSGGNSAAGGTQASGSGDAAAGGQAGAASSGAGAGTQQQASSSSGNGAASGAGGARTFTQEEVNRLTGAAREEGRQAAQKRTEQSSSGGQGQNGQGNGQAQTPAAPQGALTPEAIAEIAAKAATAVLQQHQTQSSLREEARRVGYSEDQIALVELAHPAEKPTNTGEWLKTFAAKNRIQLNPPGPDGRPAYAAPHVPRKLDEMRDSSGLVDVFSLQPEEVARLGPARLRAEFEKVLEAGRGSSGAPPVPEVSRRK